MKNLVTADFAVVCYAPQLTNADVSAVKEAVLTDGAHLTGSDSGEGDGYRTERLLFSAPSMDLAQVRRTVRNVISTAARSSGTQIAGQPGAAVVPGALLGTTRKLLVMDVDSTLIKQEVIELLAAHVGRETEVAAITEAAMRGELDFTQSLHQRVAVLAGLPESVFDDIAEHIELSDGADVLIDTFLAAGHAVAAVSGGFSQILEPLADRLGLTYSRANILGTSAGKLTGNVEGTVVDRAVKEDALRGWAAELGIAMEHTIAVGDGANDLDMLAAAGLGVAFNAKPAVREAAACSIDVPQLDIVRHFIGSQP